MTEDEYKAMIKRWESDITEETLHSTQYLYPKTMKSLKEMREVVGVSE